MRRAFDNVTSKARRDSVQGCASFAASREQMSVHNKES